MLILSEGQQVSKSLLLQMLIYGETAKTCINVKTRELTAMKVVSGIPLYACCGGKDLSRDFFRTVMLYRTERKGRRKSEHVEIAKSTSFDLVARHMSIQLPITAEDCRALLVPFLEKGVSKIYLYTRAGSFGVPSMVEPKLCKEKFGFKNKWLASGTRPHNDWSYVNRLLRERNSPYRVLTSSLDLASEKESKIEVALERALKRIEELEKGV